MLYLELKRRERHWTQMQLAGLARIPQSWISKIECGRFIPNPDEIQRLARALDLPPSMVMKTVTIVIPSGASKEDVVPA